MTIKDVIIFGAEGLAKDTYVLLLDNNNNVKYPFCCKFEIIGFIDEINYDRELFGLPVRKCVYDYTKNRINGIYVIIAVGHKRKNIKEGLDNNSSNFKYVNVIHPDTYINRTVNIGIGNIIMKNVTISGNVKIGNCVCVYYQSCISHDCIVEDYSTICPGVTICGNVNIGKGCFIGAGTVVKEKVSIVDNVLIGAGSLVLKDIEKEGIYYGHPIRRI